MWAKVDDRLAKHEKIALAGRLVGGPNGGAIALGMVTWGLLYAAQNLTDGFIPDEALAVCPLCRDAKKVAENLAKAKLRPDGNGLWRKVPDGWQINDYHDYNPRADEVRAKRDKDRQRKEIERRHKLGLPPVSEGCPNGQGADTATDNQLLSEGCPSGQMIVSEGCPSSRARAGASRVPVPSRPVPVPSEVHQAPVDTPTPSKEKAPPPAVRARDRPPDHATFAQACAIVRSVLDQGDDWTYPGGDGDLRDLVKQRLADLNMETDTATISKALDAVEETQRKRERRRA